MSEPRTVTVKTVEVKQGTNSKGNPWTKYTLVDGNDEKAGTFDGKVGAFLQASISKKVDVVTEKDGHFTNLISAVEHVEAPKSNGNGYSYSRDPESELRIAREAALHAVTRLHAGANVDIDSILVLADRAVRWIYGGLRPELAGVVPAKPVDATERIAAEMERLGAQARITTQVTGITFKLVNGGSGKRFTVSTTGLDGAYYTFSETAARALKQAQNDRATVTLVFHETEFGREIDEVEDGPSDGPIRGRPVTVPA